MTKVLDDVKHATIHPIIEDSVEKQSEIQSDALHSYKGLSQKGYTHNTVNHGAGQYVSKSGVTVNSIESFWSRLKLSIKGTHIHVSKKHLANYAAEFEYRFNSSGCPELILSELLTKFAK
ncbi:MAG: IS1595 family transposase [Rickettsiales bacterium]|nr:IS1595 family transposase [Rickettsiales bacterium]